MNGVIGMSQILAETSLDHTQREYVDIIRGSAKALLSLINDVLDLSKIEADRLELESVDFDPRDVIYETVAATSLQAAAKCIELVVNVGIDVPVIARGDPGRLRQIVMNLIANAVKFTHEGHVVLDATATVDDKKRVTMRIEVTDTGIGIPADRLDRLFKTFSQIDSSTTRHYGGSGLGLSIVKRLAELMGGEVGVRSEAGRGSSFWTIVRLEAVLQEAQREAVGRGRRVLVVDDLKVSRDSIARKLKLAAFETVAVGGVDAALAELSKAPAFDLVMADELMPVRGGLDLLAALRADPRHAKLPFMLMSLFGSERRAGEWQHQPDAVVLKPMRAAPLTLLMGQTIQGRVPEKFLALTGAAENSRFRGRRILLVDDNPVNQHVARRTLQKFAAEVTIANNGAEALERLAEWTFDAVLMDCRMPVMDGFTATRRIRALEDKNGSKRLPIIALTAMSEDRERCIDAGMDAHLGKPLEPAQLADCLARYVKSKQIPEVDMRELSQVTGGDAEFERDLIHTFITSGDQALEDIRGAVETGDYATVGARAHSLKGASADIHATGLAAAAAALERAARSGAPAEIPGLVREVSTRLAGVNAVLRRSGG